MQIWNNARMRNWQAMPECHSRVIVSTSPHLIAA
jgi:hypothetical protein